MYLISTSPYPFSAADIRAVLGLKSEAHDLLIEAGIASICLMSRRPVRTEVWAIADGADVERYGTPSGIGKLRRVGEQDQRLFRDVTYQPDPVAVAVARERVACWCLDQLEIALALQRETRAANEDRTADQLRDAHWRQPPASPRAIGALTAVLHG